MLATVVSRPLTRRLPGVMFPPERRPRRHGTSVGNRTKGGSEQRMDNLGGVAPTDHEPYLVRAIATRAVVR